MSQGARTTKDRLITAARAMFEERGWEGTTGEAIRDRADVSSGSWTHFFRDGKVGVAKLIYLEADDAIWGAVLSRFAMPSRLRGALIEHAHEVLLARISENRGRARLLFQLEIALSQ